MKKLLNIIVSLLILFSFALGKEIEKTKSSAFEDGPRTNGQTINITQTLIPQTALSHSESTTIRAIFGAISVASFLGVLNPNIKPNANDNFVFALNIFIVDTVGSISAYSNHSLTEAITCVTMVFALAMLSFYAPIQQNISHFNLNQ